MPTSSPPLNALRAFEAAARHLSLTRAAVELRVTTGALSHQIRGLEELLGLKLFERRVRSVALTSAGKRLYPGLQTGFMHIKDAVAGLRRDGAEHVLVISTAPGLTAKWLAPRLYRFSAAYPEIDVRISSTIGAANFTTDGVDAAVRNLPADAKDDSKLVIDKLIDLRLAPLCSPSWIAAHGPIVSPEALKGAPLIHDDSLAHRIEIPTWADWFKTAGVDGVDVSRGLRFSSADHAIDATLEGAGVLLTFDVLAYDALRAGRLVVPFPLTLQSGRAYYFVCPRNHADRANVRAFREWVKLEAAAFDWRDCLSSRG